MPKSQHNSHADVSASAVDSIEATGSAFRRTARRISQRTTDLIAIAIVSIGILSVSGRLSEWWNTDPQAASSPAMSASQLAGPAVRWGNGESAVSLLAGEYPVRMERRILVGDQKRIDDLLRDRLINILETAPSRIADVAPAISDEKTPNLATAEFNSREKRLVELLHDLLPIESRSGEWKLYRLDRTDNPVPGTFLIATRIARNNRKTESLAAWAMAIPRNARQWTSFVMTPTGTGKSSNKFSVPVPEDARLLLSLRADSDDELAVFQRVGARRSDISRWIREISDQLANAGWQQTRPWQQSGDSAAARFEQARDGQYKQQRAIEFAISIDGSNKMTGTANLIVIPEMELVLPGITDDSPTSDGQHEL